MKSRLCGSNNKSRIVYLQQIPDLDGFYKVKSLNRSFWEHWRILNSQFIISASTSILCFLGAQQTYFNSIKYNSLSLRSKYLVL